MSLRGYRRVIPHDPSLQKDVPPMMSLQNQLNGQHPRSFIGAWTAGMIEIQSNCRMHSFNEAGLGFISSLWQPLPRWETYVAAFPLPTDHSTGEQSPDNYWGLSDSAQAYTPLEQRP